MARQIVETGEIMVFVGKDFVVTVRHGEHGGLSEVRKRMDADPEQLRWDRTRSCTPSPTTWSTTTSRSAV